MVKRYRGFNICGNTISTPKRTWVLLDLIEQQVKDYIDEIIREGKEMANNTKGPKPAPEGETKSDKFKRVATPRLNNAIKTIGLLEATANKSVYEYTDDQRRLIEEHLTNAVNRVRDAFAGKTVAAGGVSL